MVARFPRWFRALVTCLALGACAAPGSDVAVAPVFTRVAAADGGTRHEAAAGLWRSRSDDEGLERYTFGPLRSWDRKPDGNWSSRFLVPLGYGYERYEDRMSLLVPLYIYRKKPRADGTLETRLFVLPGVMVRNNEERGIKVGVFPFYGRLEGFLTYDEVTFVLFPLWVRTKAGGRVSNSVLWPIFGWTRGGGAHHNRIFPLWGRARFEGRYDRTFVLWPIFHRERNFLGGGGEEPEDVWWVWPLYGKKTRGDYTAHTVLWPFFGYARDTSSGFWAWDGPWPFVRFQHGGRRGVNRERVWPFYGHLEGDGIDRRSYLWPLVHVSTEKYVRSEREQLNVIPFWQSWNRIDLETGQESSWCRAWPLFQVEKNGAWQRGSFPSLLPFQRQGLMDRHYGWLWKVYEWEREGVLRRERGWAGLWRRERDAGEDRRYLTFLWSDRRYADAEGRATTETSLLFGLLRWRRTEGAGLSILPPAFPGPGWPAERAPAPAPREGS
jgi:hypothetical protein